MSEETGRMGADRMNAHDDRQERALAALLAGASHAEAAEAASVHRTTVSRWATVDPAFMAERNRRRAEAAGVTAARMRAIAGRALEVVSTAVEAEAAEGGATVALKVLGLVGTANLLGEDAAGLPTTADAVLNAAAQERDRSGNARTPLARFELEREWAAALWKDAGPTAVANGSNR